MSGVYPRRRPPLLHQRRVSAESYVSGRVGERGARKTFNASDDDRCQSTEHGNHQGKAARGIGANMVGDYVLQARGSRRNSMKMP